MKQIEILDAHPEMKAGVIMTYWDNTDSWNSELSVSSTEMEHWLENGWAKVVERTEPTEMVDVKILNYKRSNPCIPYVSDPNTYRLTVQEGGQIIVIQTTGPAPDPDLLKKAVRGEVWDYFGIESFGEFCRQNSHRTVTTAKLFNQWRAAK